MELDKAIGLGTGMVTWFNSHDKCDELVGLPRVLWPQTIQAHEEEAP